MEGIDEARVEAWLTSHVPQLTPPFAYDLIAGGRSNLTFDVTDATGQRFVLRRPPLGSVLQSAHDMGREHRIISALVPTAVPVPVPLGYCEDPGVNGAPFYVMRRVDGLVLRNADGVPASFGEPQRARLGESMIDVLADLGAVDPDGVGVGDLGRREGYVERTLRRWHGQFEKSRAREVPAIDEVHRRLAGSVPPQQRVSIVHGDFRVENVIFGEDGNARAVLDWELCTLGDPLADLGWMLAYWTESGEDEAHMSNPQPTVLPGFATREQLVERYVQRTGLDVSELDYYVAFGMWKLACVAVGVEARYRSGAMGEDDGVADRMTAAVDALGEAALQRTARLA